MSDGRKVFCSFIIIIAIIFLLSFLAFYFLGKIMFNLNFPFVIHFALMLSLTVCFYFIFWCLNCY